MPYADSPEQLSRALGVGTSEIEERVGGIPSCEVWLGSRKSMAMPKTKHKSCRAVVVVDAMCCVVSCVEPCVVGVPEHGRRPNDRGGIEEKMLERPYLNRKREPKENRERVSKKL